MKKIDNIEHFDDLLKQQFNSFAPEPPAEVWQNLSQHHAIGNTSVASKFVSAVKSMSIVSKAIIALAFVVVSATSVLLLQENKPLQTSNHTINTLPKVDEDTKIVNPTKAIEDKPSTEAFTKSYNQRGLQVENKIIEKYNTNTVETKIVQEASSIENKELKADSKPSIIETQQGQTQVEKTIVKSPKLESNSIKEPETLNQTNKTIALSDVDTSIAPEIPNTFTPGDDDNFNKEFVIKIDNENTYRLRVFDSKANLVFESFKKEVRWNGQHFKSGENCESGKYFYIFDYQYKGAKELRQKTGNILLTR